MTSPSAISPDGTAVKEHFLGEYKTQVASIYKSRNEKDIFLNEV